MARVPEMGEAPGLAEAALEQLVLVVPAALRPLLGTRHLEQLQQEMQRKVAELAAEQVRELVHGVLLLGMPVKRPEV